VAGCTLGIWSTTVMAGNGLNDIGFGAQSSGMAGADLGVARDTAALNINPSGLSQISGSAIDAYLEPFYEFSARHLDSLGNDQSIHDPWGASVGGGYARRLPNYGVVLGVGLFGQGGSGFQYQNLITPFGPHRDEVGANFATVKLEPGLAWQATDTLSVGAALGINYSQAREKFLPTTSFVDPSGKAPSFFGFRVDGLGGWSVNEKLGFQYRPDKRWVVGGEYTGKTQVKLDGGTATFDYSAAQLGFVTYNNVSLKGFAIAQQAGIGASFQPVEAWLIDAQLTWVDWSGAMKSSTLIASNPNNQLLPQNLQNLSLTSPLDWRDQYVVAVGTEYRYNELTALRCGINYGRNPVPGTTLSPTLPLILDRAVAVGFSRHLSGGWEFSGSSWYGLRNKVHYSNPDSPFGPTASESIDVLVLNFMISRRW
jgi:long-chain fatty acid transport protein